LEEKLLKQQKEAARRENTLVHRLTTKEQELQDYLVSLAQLFTTWKYSFGIFVLSWPKVK
jgi:hypothetical protein